MGTKDSILWVSVLGAAEVACHNGMAGTQGLICIFSLCLYNEEALQKDKNVAWYAEPHENLRPTDRL
jgi:hypothetical protein